MKTRLFYKIRFSLSLEQITLGFFQSPISLPSSCCRARARLILKRLLIIALQFAVRGKETLYIEGAGGLMVPLNDTETWVDF